MLNKIITVCIVSMLYSVGYAMEADLIDAMEIDQVGQSDLRFETQEADRADLPDTTNAEANGALEVALGDAAQKGNQPLVAQLIGRGARYNCLLANKRTVLFAAIVSSNLVLVQWLVKTYPDLLKICDRFGNTPLLFSVRHGSNEIVEFLIKAASDLVKIASKTGQTILHKAVGHSKRALVALFVKEYPDLILKEDVFGCKPLNYAEGRNEIVRILNDAENKLKPTRSAKQAVVTSASRDSQEGFMLDRASVPSVAYGNELQQISLAEVLDFVDPKSVVNGKPVLHHYLNDRMHGGLIGRCDIDAQDSEGDTVLMLVLRSKAQFGVKNILEWCPDLNRQNKLGETALIIAAKNGLVAEMSWLLKMGANPNIRDNEGNTFISYLPTDLRLYSEAWLGMLNPNL